MDENMVRLSARVVAAELLRAAAGYAPNTNRWHDPSLSDGDNEAIRKALLYLAADLCRQGTEP